MAAKSQSDETPTEISREQRIKNIPEYENLQAYLRHQLKECITKLSLCDDDKDDRDEKYKKDAIEIVEECNNKATEILETNAHKLLRKNIMELLQFSEEGFKAIYCESGSANQMGSENPTSESRAAISSMLLDLYSQNCEILQKMTILQKLREESQNQDVIIYDLTQKSREKIAILERAREFGATEERQRECEKNNPRIKLARENLEFDVRKLRCVKQIFQSAIQASKVDWFEDDTLCATMLELGMDTKPIFNYKLSD